MFKSITIYKLKTENPDLIGQDLTPHIFTPCGPTQPLALGWVAPRGVEHGALIESIGGHHIMRVRIESRAVPGDAVKREVAELAQKIEESTGRKPGRKQTKELQEEARLTLLPKAFSKFSEVPVWLDQKAGLLILGTSGTKAETIVTHLVRSFEGLSVEPLLTQSPAASAMAAWLGTGEAPYNFSIDREVTLKAADEMKSTVKYARHALDIEEVREHIKAGKVPQSLAMTWNGRISFVLTDTLQVSKIEFDGVVFEGTQKSDDAFDADAAISTGELSTMIPDLIAALGGELAAGTLPQAMALAA